MRLALSDRALDLIVACADRLPAERRIEFIVATAHQLFPDPAPSDDQVFAALQAASQHFQTEMAALQ